MYKYIKRFSKWYVRHVEESILINLVIVLLQIPHMIWNADLYLEFGTISKVNPVSDFVLYGVDLLEIPLIIKIVTDFIILKRKKLRKKKVHN